MIVEPTKPYGVPRTDALFHELSVAPYGEAAYERIGRVEGGLLRLCVQLEKELIASQAKAVTP